MNAPQASYTLRRIADVLGVSKAAVKKRLADVHRAPILVEGQTAFAYSWADMPQGLRGDIAARARQQGYSGPIELLDGPPASEAPKPPTPAPGPALTSDCRDQFQELGETLSQIKDRHQPTWAERAWIFPETFRHLDRLAGEEAERRGLVQSIVRFLFATVPGISRTGDKALRRTFDRQYARWKASGKPARLEVNHVKCGYRRPGLCPACAKLLFDGGMALGGENRASTAWRRLIKEGKFCPECQSRIHFNPRKYKSYMPHRERREYNRKVFATSPWLLGRRNAESKGPPGVRVWSDVAPGDWMSADDVTWNHYYWYWDEIERRKKVARGECLLMVDLRTDYPVAFLQINGHYNSEHVRRLALSAHDTFGLPRLGYYYERGVWKSRLTNPAQVWRGRVPLIWQDTELGLIDSGLFSGPRPAFQHATRPQAKTIEGVLGRLQNEMQCLPGYVGRDEKKEKDRELQDFLGRVNRGTEQDPGKELYSFDQWNQAISKCLEAFANDEQNGKRLKGLSPLEAWRNGIGSQPGVNQRPLQQLSPENRWWLNSDKKLVKVTREGIRVKVRQGTEAHLYYGEATGNFIGQEVLATYDLESPRTICFFDMKGKKWYSAKEHPLPAMSATTGQLQEAKSARNAHMAPAKVMFGKMVNPFVSTITRDNDMSQAATEAGKFMNEAKAKDEAAEKERNSEMDRLRRCGQKIGIQIPANAVKPERVQQGISLYEQGLAEWRAENQRI